MEEEFIVHNQPKIKFEVLFQHATVGILVINSEGRIEQANPYVEQLFGYTPKELEGQLMDVLMPETFHHKQLQYGEGYFELPKARPTDGGMDSLGVKKNGTTFPIDISLIPYQIEGHEAAVAFVTDMTERNRAFADIKAIEEDFRNLYENDLIALVVTDRTTHKILAVNEQMVKLLGYDSKQDFFDNHTKFVHYVHPEQQEKNRHILEKTGILKNKVVEWKKRDGTHFWVNISAYVNPYKNIIQTLVIDTTEEKIAQDEIKKSEEKYRNIFEGSLVGILTWDVNTQKIMDINPKGVALFGYKNREDCLENYNPLNHFEQEERENLVKEIKTYGELRNKEVKIKKLDGTLIWLVFYSKVNLENKVLYSKFIDITDRKALEEDFRSIYENTEFAMIVSDATTYKAINVNKKCVLLLGYDSKQDFLDNYNPLIHYVNTEDRDRNRAALKEYGISTNKMMPVKKRDGTLLWVNATLTVNPYKNIIQTVFIDITEEVQANEELKASEENYKNIYNNSIVSMYTTDRATFKALDANDMAVKLFGYTSKEDFLAHFDPRAHVVVTEDFKRNLATLEATGELNHKALSMKKVDGTHFWANAFVKFNSDGRTAQAVIIDVTEQVRFQEELEAKVKERTLELTESLAHEKEVNDMKSRLVAIAAHEFRTPLTTIMSSLFLLDVYTHQGQSLKKVKHMDRIRSSVKNLVGILNSFLSVDRLEHGRMEVVKEPFVLHEFLEDIVEEMYILLKQGQSINMSFEGEKEVVLDKKILKNLLINLLSNAIKYSWENKVIHLSSEVKHQQVTIQVKDEGIGIPEAEQANMFKKFYRASNAKDIQGTGLGLNIVQKYVELLDGTIEFESKPEEGTTFTVTFPQK